MPDYFFSVSCIPAALKWLNKTAKTKQDSDHKGITDGDLEQLAAGFT